MPSDSRRDDGHDHASVQEVPRTGDDLHDAPGGSRNSVRRSESSQSSASHTTSPQRSGNPPLPVGEPGSRQRRKKYSQMFGLQSPSASTPVGGPTGMYISSLSSSESISIDSQGYAPSQPFEEAGPTSSIWRAYLDESFIYDTDMLGNQRGQVNILLVFVS